MHLQFPEMEVLHLLFFLIWDVLVVSEVCCEHLIYNILKSAVSVSLLMGAYSFISYIFVNSLIQN